MPNVHHLPAATENLTVARDSLNDHGETELRDSDVEEVAPHYAALHLAVAELTVVRSALASSFASRIGRDPFTGSGFTLVPRFGRTRKEWDNAALLSRLEEEVIRRTVYDQDGTMRTFDDVADVARQAFRTVAEVCQLGGSQLRAGVLRKWSIDPDRYAESVTGSASLEVIAS